MAQPSHPGMVGSPPRRGTPSTSEHIPYFGSFDARGSADFYSTIGQATSTATHGAGAYQAAPLDTLARQQSAPSQPAFPQGSYQRVPGAPSMPFEVPPRCATGPAVEYPHRSQGGQAYPPNGAGLYADPYRSASVVYGGPQYAFHSTPAANSSASWAPGGSAFFDQFAGNSEIGAATSWQQEAHAPDNHYAAVHAYSTDTGSAAAIATSAQVADPGHGTQAAAADGVVFDQAAQQYYDTASGQYYDDASGVWYYPQQEQPQALSPGELYTPDGHATGTTAHDAPLSGLVQQVDGAAFFESISATAASTAPPEATIDPHTVSAAPGYPGSDGSFGGFDASQVVATGESAAVYQPGPTNGAPQESMASPSSRGNVPDHHTSDSAAMAAAGPPYEPLASGVADMEAEGTSAACSHPPNNESLMSGAAHQPAELAEPPTGATDASLVYADTNVVEPSPPHPPPSNTHVGQEYAQWSGDVCNFGGQTEVAPVAAHSTSAEDAAGMDVSRVVAELGHTDTSHDATGISQPFVPGDGTYPVNGASFSPTPATGYADGTTYNDDMAADTAYSAHLADTVPAHSGGGYASTTQAGGHMYYMADYGEAQDLAAIAQPATVVTTGYDPLDAQPVAATAEIGGGGDGYVQSRLWGADGGGGGDYGSDQQYGYPQGHSDGGYAPYTDVYGDGLAASSMAGVPAYTPATVAPAIDAAFTGGMMDMGAPQPAGSFGYYSQGQDLGTAASTASAVNGAATNGVTYSAGISDPLGRLSARYPIAALGFGGKLVTMFPRQVQRFNNHHSDGALKIAPGMMRVHQLSDCIAQEHSWSLLAPMPLLTGDTARAALEKRRDTAIACVKALLETTAFPDSLGPEKRALFDVVVAILRTADQPDFQTRSLDEATEAIRPLFAPRQPVHGDEGAAVPISHGSAEDLRDLETLLLAGKRSEAIDIARQRGMWAHALVVASCTGKQDWQAVVSAYTGSVLRGDHACLGTQYRLFAGLGGLAFDEPRHLHGRHQSTASDKFVTAADIGGAGAQENRSLQTDGTGDWARTLALALANRTPNDQSAFLALGDRLKEGGQITAAHICYALTLPSRAIFVQEPGADCARAVLLGAAELERCEPGGGSFEPARSRFSRYYRNHAAVFLTELY
ncbi:hypothetical protein H4R19_003701, partial [Coemansia spiralis]